MLRVCKAVTLRTESIDIATELSSSVRYQQAEHTEVEKSAERETGFRNLPEGGFIFEAGWATIPATKVFLLQSINDQNLVIVGLLRNQKPSPGLFVAGAVPSIV